MNTLVSPIGPRSNDLATWQAWMAALAEKHGERYAARAERLRREGMARKGEGS